MSRGCNGRRRTYNTNGVVGNLLTRYRPYLEVRLAGSAVPFSGRVEVNLDDGNGWGTVCDDGWDEDDARVVCRSLGLRSSKPIPILSAYFGSGTGTINMDDVNCAGTEESLRNCTFTHSSFNDCSHSEDAGVMCFLDKLSGGMGITPYINKDNGHLLISYKIASFSLNFSVCDTNFGLNEARISCHEIGYSRYTTVLLPAGNTTHDQGNGYMQRVTIDCSSSFSKIASCNPIRIYYGFCPNGGNINPKFVCGYKRVRQINLRGNTTSGSILLLNQQEEVSCETEYARPKPEVTWYINEVPYYVHVQKTTMTSRSLHKVDSTLTLFPYPSLHGKHLICCSRDLTGYEICTKTYTLHIKVLGKGNKSNNVVYNTHGLSMIHVIAYCVFGITVITLAAVIVILQLRRQKSNSNDEGHRRQQSNSNNEVPVHHPEVAMTSFIQDETYENVTYKQSDDEQEQYEEIMRP